MNIEQLVLSGLRIMKTSLYILAMALTSLSPNKSYAGDLKLSSSVSVPLKVENFTEIDGFEGLVATVCEQLKASKANGIVDIGQHIDRVILSFLKHEEFPLGNNISVPAFLKITVDHFICPGSFDYEEQHIYKRVIVMDLLDRFFHNYLLSDKFGQYRVNIVNSFLDAPVRKTTILDCIDEEKRSEKYRRDEGWQAKIDELEEILTEDFSAKRAREL